MTAEPIDYKNTLNLPKTNFPMRAGLPNREPGWLERWEKIGIYKKLRQKTRTAQHTPAAPGCTLLQSLACVRKI